MTDRFNPEASVVMPAYNLENVIVDSVREVCRVLDGLVGSYEVIVVDDGSDDGTYRIASSIADGAKIKVFRNGVNEGKGSAVKKGVFQASGRYTVILDADMDIKPSQIGLYLKALKNADVVVASKRHPASVYEAPLMRKLLSFGFNTLTRIMTGVKVRDTQTGLKAFRTDVLKFIMENVLVKRYAFDVEVLALASLLNLKIVEAPVKVKLGKGFSLKSVLQMLLDLLGITYRLRISKYYQKSLEGLKENLEEQKSSRI
jgi:glycosyltransferase involved in cell wall biosynthesis